MTNPPRVVSSWVSWLIAIVLSLTGALAHATTCDVDADGDIDRKDYLAILADVGERANGPSDPRDADRNGRILSNDAQLCARRCTLPLCAIPTNKAPTAKNDAATTALNTPVRINVIANDRDRDGRIVPSTVSIVTKPKHGKVTNHRNGKVTYSPARGFRGRDSFRYTVKDNRGAKSNVATVTVTVRPGVPPANVPPVANNDSAGTAVNTPVLINVVANDTDANGNLDPTTVAIVSNPANGAVVNNLNGTVTYTPSPGFIGTGSFTYTVNDTQGATSNVATVTVGVNATPAANAGPDANAVTGQPVTLDGSGSSDPNGDMITFSWRFLSTALGSNLADTDIVNRTSPAPSFTPDVDGAYELELTVTDPGGLSDTDTVVITAATPNVAPNADAGLDQNAEVLTLVNLDGSGSSDPDNGPVTPLTFQWSFVSVPVGSGIDETDLQPDANSTQPSFTPDVIGIYRLTLTVSDGDLTDTDDVDINVALPNVPPNANAGADFVVQLGPPAETATLDGTGSNDSDNGPVTPLTFQWTFVSVAPGSSLTNGDIQDANTVTASFTPDAAGMYTLQLRVFDGLDEAFDEVMVTANAAPVAVADAFDADEDTPLTVPAPGVLTNDTDANNDTLTAVLNTGPSNAAPGSFILNPDGSFDYTPNADFTGDDSFTYHANDGSVDSNAAATVTITVIEANDAPVAVDDPSYTTNEDGGALAGTSVLTNDTDAENDTLTAVLDTDVTNGTLVFNTDGTFSYTPNADFFGTDTFTYHANDGNSDSNVATATITVDPINDAPSFGSGSNVMVLEDAGLVTVNPWATGISAGPANESSQTLVFNITGNTAPGLFAAGPTVSSSGVLSFTTALNAFGSAIITLELQDNGGTANGGVDTSASQGFTIIVTAVNDPPVATAKAHQTHSGIRVTIGAGDTGRLKDGATDVDDPFGDLAVSASFGSITPAGATIVLSDAATGTFTYNPPAGFSGPASFQFQVCDDGAPTPPAMCSAPATVSFNVTGPDLWFVQQGASGTGRLTDPFGTLASLPATRGTGDRIFVFTGTYGTGLTVLTNEHLIGQGSSGSFDTVLGVTVPGNGTLDTRPTLAGTLAARPQLNGTVTVGSGSTVRGLNIASTTATGLSGGAVAGVSVSEASVTSTTGTAVNLNGTGGTVGLTSVSSNGAANGIVLNTTTGSFTVTGTGAPGTGGTIQSTTNRGASFISAQNISLTNMNFTNTASLDLDADNSGLSTGDNLTTNAAIHLETVFTATLNGIVINGSAEQGINGRNVKDFTLQNSSITNAGNGADEDGIHFYNMLGTSAITNTTITNSGDDNINIQNNTPGAHCLPATCPPLPAGMTAVLNLTITNGSANTGVLGSGYLMGIRGTSTATVTIDGVTANNNFSGGVVIDTFDTATSTIEVKNSTSTNNNDGISLSSNNGSTKFDIHDNVSFAGNDFGRINILKAAFSTGGTLQGKIRNNPVVVANGQAADGISVFQAGAGALNVAITDNTIDYQGTQRPILVQGGQDGVGTLAATITGNDIDVKLDGTGNAVAGMLVQAAVASADANPDTNMCADIGGASALKNVFTHSLGNNMAAGDIRVRQRFETTVTLPGYGGANNDDAAVVAYLAARNTLVNSPTATATNNVGGGGGGFVGGACTQPVFP